MPQQTVGAASAVFANIGKKMIMSGVNYEDEIRKKVSAE